MVEYIHSLLDFRRLRATQKIALSFLAVILIGTILLMLPIAHHNGERYPLIDALFTATSATCVTGLVVDVTLSEFTLFGQLVIMGLIQIGGLGLMTLMAVFVLLLKSRLSMHESMAIKEMLNQDKVIDLRHFLMDLLKYTLVFEGIGMALLCVRFIPEYGGLLGIFKAMFISISAFCNAGFDIIGANSLMPYAHDPLVMLTIMALIVLGGLGFAVWFDLRDKIKQLWQRKLSFHKVYSSLSLHTKIVLVMTSFLIVTTAVLILLLEFSNPDTIGYFQPWEKGLSALFESVTLRTAGFASLNYNALRLATQFLMILIMFIGGSPGGTAGGIKTTTLAVLVIYVISNLRSQANTVLYRRTISREIIIRAMGIFFMNMLVLLLGIFFLCIFEEHGFVALAFEAASALATVGLSLGITASLSIGGKIVIILLMFIGRIGITTFVLSIVSHRSHTEHQVVYPNGNIIVG